MNPFTSWLTSLLASIIRPIIKEEITALKNYLQVQLARKEAFEHYDREVQKLSEELASASTAEEKWAILQKIKNSRAVLKP